VHDKNEQGFILHPAHFFIKMRKGGKMKAEDLKEFSDKFITNLIPKYIDFILEKFDSFLDYSNIVNEMPRSSDEFKNLSKYHSHAMNHKRYKEFYRISIGEMEE
jgi:hypothetical protein